MVTETLDHTGMVKFKR